MTSAEQAHIRELVGVYHADGGVRGELAYAAGKLLGRTHCELCDITHRGVRRKRGWDAMVAWLGVPFRLVHLNERDADITAAGTRTPCVLARTDDGLVLILGPDELRRANGDVATFEQVLRHRLPELGLRLR